MGRFLLELIYLYFPPSFRQQLFGGRTVENKGKLIVIQYIRKIIWREHIQRMDGNRLSKKIKLQTWKEKKYRKTTNEIGRWFPGGRNSPRGLSLIVDDDYDYDDDDYYYYYY